MLTLVVDETPVPPRLINASCLLCPTVLIVKGCKSLRHLSSIIGILLEPVISISREHESGFDIIEEASVCRSVIRPHMCEV